MAVTVVACSGISNTGKLTFHAGTALVHRSCGAVEACIAATRPTASLENALRHAERILVLDGCSDCCGRKKVQALGVEPHLHLVATDCGIEKNGMAEPRFEEIERLAAAVLEAVRR
ncbi:zinc-binding protein [Methanoculleus sp. FWC-SCC1]|uniref:Zinc-binding protein n=1 Tax=Methanoculleus frigidifontis TaxID=2584085 RepID=A0ABT8M7Y9_9EURY|nr:putative zinc-binding protein [Methanoculleus sp. FWC-SCC1]MDN7024047.1 zinc-binding protein [Methanoculleus sp. FWC-SCC1]